MFFLPFFPFLLFSTRDLRAPSADCCETLPHDRNLGALYNGSQKIRGPSPQRNRAQNIQNFGQFHTTSEFDREYLRNGSSIQNRKTYWSRAIPPAFYERSPVNFGPLTTDNCMWVWTHPNCIFRETIFRPLRGAGPSNFNTHYRLTKAC